MMRTVHVEESMEELTSLGVEHFVFTIIIKIQRYSQVVCVLVVVTMHMLRDHEGMLLKVLPHLCRQSHFHDT
jgi:hypothetical protein